MTLKAVRPSRYFGYAAEIVTENDETEEEETAVVLAHEIPVIIQGLAEQWQRYQQELAEERGR